MNTLGVISVVLSVLLFAVTHKLLKDRPAAFRWILLLVLSVLATPSVLFAVYYLHVLPEWAWFYEFRSRVGTELLVLFLGCAAGAAASILPRRVLVAPLLALLGLASVPYIKPLLRPIPNSTFQEHWQGGVCFQSTDSTCGPASVCTILKKLGRDASERTVARAAYSSASGTEAWYLARYVRSLGFLAKFDFRETFSPSAGLPAVVGVRIEGAGHFIAVLAVNDGKVNFADPLTGEETLPLAEFQKRYEFTGFHLVISKPGD